MDQIKIDITNESEQIKRIFKGKDLVSLEDLFAMIEEKDDEVSSWEDRYHELENDLHDNYQPISPYKLYDVNEKDFY